MEFSGPGGARTTKHSSSPLSTTVDKAAFTIGTTLQHCCSAAVASNVLVNLFIAKREGSKAGYGIVSCVV